MTKTLKNEKQLYMYEVVTRKGIYYMNSSKKTLLPKLFGLLLKKGTRPLSFNKKVLNEELINFTEEGEL